MLVLAPPCHLRLARAADTIDVDGIPITFEAFQSQIGDGIVNLLRLQLSDLAAQRAHLMNIASLRVAEFVGRGAGKTMP